MNPQNPPATNPGNGDSQNNQNNYGGQNPPAIDPNHPVHNPLSVMAPGEQVVCEIRRHPIGIFGIYGMTGLLLIVLAILAFIVVPNIASSNGHQTSVIGAMLFLLIGVGALGFVLVAHIVYWGNSWVVTSDSITQITQTSLFRKQSSQLSLGNLEDVTAEQNGVLPHMFNYGVLRVETAGERSKFLFPFCPNPSYYAKQVLAAREAFEQGRSNEENEQRLYRQDGAYQPAYQPPQPPAPMPQAYQPANNYISESAPNPAPQVFQTPTMPAPFEPPTPPVTPPAPPAPFSPPPSYPSEPPAPPPTYPAYTPPPTTYESPPDNGVNLNTE